jgi:hypothetical protein
VPANVSITWSTAQVVKGPCHTLELRAALDPPPDLAWDRAFDQRIPQGPIDGQWTPPAIEGGRSIVVRGILKSVDEEALRTWLDNLVKDVNTLAERIRQEEVEASARWVVANEEAERRAREMQERLRST